MRAQAWTLGLILGACEGGGSGDEGGPDGAQTLAFEPATPPAVAAFAQAADTLLTLSRSTPFDVKTLGDPALYSGSSATAPTAPDVMASVYFETEGLAPALEALRDRRAGVTADSGAGAAIASRVALDFTTGFASTSPGDAFGGAAWAARRIGLSLDAFLVVTATLGLEERSAAGWDRAVATLFDAEGAPHALGARIAEGDAHCGGAALEGARAALAGVRGPFADALEALGRPDALDRLTIQAGDSAPYDAAVPVIAAHLDTGLVEAFVVRLDAPDFDGRAQAEADALWTALSARARALDPELDDTVTVALGQSEAAAIDRAALRSAVLTAFRVDCPAGP